MNLRIEVSDTAALAALERAPGGIARALTAAATDATMLTLRAMQIYPAQRPPRGSRAPYRRTRTLGRSWFRRVTHAGNDVIGEVVSNGNIAPYNIYVQMDAMQARVHRGYWQTEVQIVERLRPQIVEMYAARVQQAVSALR